MMDFIADIYDQIWYHFEWFLNKTARRPFTFFIHDFSHKFPYLYFILQVAVCYGFYRLVDSFWVFVPILYAFAQGHFLWGGHKVGEQEFPEFTEED
jgi:hypothetical protein